MENLLQTTRVSWIFFFYTSTQQGSMLDVNFFVRVCTSVHMQVCMFVHA